RLDHREPIELLGVQRRDVGARRPELELWMAAAELPRLALGAPPDVADVGLADVGVGDQRTATRAMKSRRGLVADRFMLDESVLARAADRLLVEPFRPAGLAVDARELGTGELGAVAEVVGAVLRPRGELRVVRRELVA